MQGWLIDAVMIQPLVFSWKLPLNRLRALCQLFQREDDWCGSPINLNCHPSIWSKLSYLIKTWKDGMNNWVALDCWVRAAWNPQWTLLLSSFHSQHFWAEPNLKIIVGLLLCFMHSLPHNILTLTNYCPSATLYKYCYITIFYYW